MTPNDNILKDVLTSVGLEKLITNIAEINTEKSVKNIEIEIIQSLTKALVHEYSENRRLRSLCEKLKLVIKTFKTIIFGSKSEKAKTLSEEVTASNAKENNHENESKKEDDICKDKEKKSENESSKNKDADKKSSRDAAPKNYENRPARKRLPEHLHRVDVVHEGNFHCPKCARAYIKTVMADLSEELAVKLYMYVLRHKRIKLVPDCKCPGIPPVYTSPKIGSVVYKSKYSNSLISFLLMNKFYMQVPIHRQRVKLFVNYSSEISEGTVNGIFKKLYEQVFPQFYNEIKAYTLKSKHLHGDETSWKVFVDKKGKKTFNHWIWVVGSANGITYIYDPSRSKSVVLRTFAPDASGIINVDRYASYNALPEGILRAFCWYHLRRDFIRLAKGVPELKKWALKWIRSIRRIEKLNDSRFIAYSKMEKSDELSPEFIKLHKRLYKLLMAFYNRANFQLKDDNINPVAHSVLTSLLKHWNGYMVFYEFPFVPMHNNASERLLRSIANARNNFLGSRATWNAELMAMVLSICETAKLHGLNPHTYMEYILAQCSLYEDRKIPNIQPLLPWNINSDILKPYENMQSLVPYINQQSSPQSPVDTNHMNAPKTVLGNESSDLDIPGAGDSKPENTLTSKSAPELSEYSKVETDFVCVLDTESELHSLPIEKPSNITYDFTKDISNSVVNESPQSVSASLVPISKKFSQLSSVAFLVFLIIFFIKSSFSASNIHTNLLSYPETDFALHIPCSLTSDAGITFDKTAVEATFAITNKELFVGLYQDTS
jgi:transposase